MTDSKTNSDKGPFNKGSDNLLDAGARINQRG